MVNKNYLDKVVDHMVRNTKIDYDKGEIIFPFTTLSTPFLSYSFLLLPSSLTSLYPTSVTLSFIKYCKKHFGLTEEEIDYVYHSYVKIIRDKI